jgi:2-amino-4-hydroxy-6-hydroxymethyldihydropteridine diphosphokinase
MVKALIGLGSNLNDPRQQLETALQELSQLPQSELTRYSSLYETAAMGPVTLSGQPAYQQPDYLNAVAELETELGPEVLLDQLQSIEAAHQRLRGEIQWGPRTLDLDLLLYGDETIGTARLTVPHPGVAERNFVLIPMVEIRPNLKLPDGRSIAELPACHDQRGVKRCPPK